MRRISDLLARRAQSQQRTNSSFLALSARLAVPVAPRSCFLSASYFFSTHSMSLSLFFRVDKSRDQHSSPHPRAALQRKDPPQLGLDNLHIPHRVYISLDVNDLRVVERTCKRGSPTISSRSYLPHQLNTGKQRTNDLEDPVNGPDVAQEVVSQSSTGSGALGESGNVDAGEERRDSV
jgi:hypothetical protein